MLYSFYRRHTDGILTLVLITGVAIAMVSGIGNGNILLGTLGVLMIIGAAIAACYD